VSRRTPFSFARRRLATIAIVFACANWIGRERRAGPRHRHVFGDDVRLAESGAARPGLVEIDGGPAEQHAGMNVRCLARELVRNASRIRTASNTAPAPTSC
jgi:hypothetical protein